MSPDAETIAVYDRQAAEYEARFATAGDRHLDGFIAALPDGARVLDQGCGPGHAAARMQAAGLVVDAFDASAEMVRLARTRGVAARLADFSDPLPAATYHGIWSSFALLHARREKFPGHLSAMKTAMVPGGLLALVLKTGTGDHRDHLGRAYAYYGEDELVGLLVNAGFTVELRRTGMSVGLAGNSDPWIAITARA